MRRSPLIIWSFALLLSAALAIPAAARWWSAREQAAAARRSFDAARTAVAEIDRLRAAAPPWMTSRRPDTGLAPRLTTVLTALSLPPTTLASLNVANQTGLGGKDVGGARQRAACTLTGTTLSQFGRFLAAWRAAEPQWIVSELDLAPDAGRGSTSAARPGSTGNSPARPVSGGGSELPLRVNLVLESVFVEERTP